jgi:TRAP-type uncharacterized transport system fused permease subunit
MGAAAFLIAEYLKISYLDVLLMAVIPTVLYYAGLLFMVELDQRRIRARGIVPDETPMQVESVGAMFRRGWYHFSSLIAIIAFMSLGYSATLPCSTRWPGGRAVLPVARARADAAAADPHAGGRLRAGDGIAATCAAAGVIVGCITLTGSG